MAQASYELNFSWVVAEEGHRWITTAAPPSKFQEPFLTSAVPIGAGFFQKRYAPFRDSTGLFRNFAALAAEPDAIKSFADRYGMLGVDPQLIPVEPRPDGQSFLTGWGESLRRWQHEITGLHRCVELHDWAMEGNVEALGRHITWEKERVTYASDPRGIAAAESTEVEGPMQFAVIARRRTHDQLFEQLAPGDLIKPARLFLQEEINKRLTEHSGLRLLWALDRDDLVNCAVPTNLLGALWLQFSLAVQRRSKFRQCKQCGTWFEVSPQMARSDKIFCSTACRVKAFRKQTGGDEGANARQNRKSPPENAPTPVSTKRPGKRIGKGRARTTRARGRT